MEINERKLKGVFDISFSPIIDERGIFMRTFDFKVLAEKDLNRNWVQENHSFTTKIGTLRGLHFQFPPYCETKLVRCIKGSVMDVFVDLRDGSPTFGQWDSVTLDATNYNMIFISRGFAHGFCSLTNFCEVLYKVDNYYSAEHECGIFWNDLDLNIPWPFAQPIISEKDRRNLLLKEFIDKHKSLKI